MSLHAPTTCSIAVAFGNKRTEINALGCFFSCTVIFKFQNANIGSVGTLRCSSFRLI